VGIGGGATCHITCARGCNITNSCATCGQTCVCRTEGGATCGVTCVLTCAGHCGNITVANTCPTTCLSSCAPTCAQNGGEC
jgi:hypothetical protein